MRSAELVVRVYRLGLGSGSVLVPVANNTEENEGCNVSPVVGVHLVNKTLLKHLNNSELIVPVTKVASSTSDE